MATQPLLQLAPDVAKQEPESRLSAEETWGLIFQSFGSAQAILAEFGGGEAFFRQERSSWQEQELA